MVGFGMSRLLSLQGWMVWFGMSCLLSLSVSEERGTPVIQQQFFVLRPLQQLHVCKNETGLKSRSCYNTKLKKIEEVEMENVNFKC
jgi:hypothetical protein